MKPDDIAIVSGARTPMGRYCEKLRDFTAMELGAIAGKEAIKRAGVDAKEFDHAVFGNAQQTSGDSLYGARHVGLKAWLPVESQELTDDAYKAGRLQEEITPVALRNRKGEPTGEMFSDDDHRRPQTTMEGLAKLRPAFGKNGTVTAGNASGIVDGGAAVVMMSA